jgi:hypothetical protein
LEAAQLGVGALELLALLIVLLSEEIDSFLESFVSGLGCDEADTQGLFAGRG